MRIIGLCCVPAIVGVASAQTPTRPAGASVTGVVRDSIGKRPLAGAVVQLVSAAGGATVSRSAISDSLGRYALTDVPDGRHTIGFDHPFLDSLGIEPPAGEVNVSGSQPVRADLAIPSPARLRASICARAGGAGRSLIMGVVRDVRGEPRAGVEVSAEWLEVEFGRGRPVTRRPRLVATSERNGWFAMCDVPSTGQFALSAGAGPDSTDRLDVEVPADGFLRRDLYLGSERSSNAQGAVSRPGVRPMRVGGGRLSGTAVAAVDGRPLASADVGIVDGPHTRANERGEWTLVDAPAGTRMLEVRAVGYYPTRRAVDVVDVARPIRIALPTLKAVLDTVRITAARLADRHHSGFEDRRRIAVGRYLTADDIQRHQPRTMAQVLRMVPGIRIDRTVVQGMTMYDSTGALIPQATVADNKIMLRASVDDWCFPAIYVNGHYMRDLDADDLDAWARPSDLLGVEVYAGISAPAEYQQGMTGCGSVLIWTKG